VNWKFRRESIFANTGNEKKNNFCDIKLELKELTTFLLKEEFYEA
jgi:hypothetical protein